MKKISFGICFMCFSALLFLSQCAEKPTDTTSVTESAAAGITGYEVAPTFGGYESQVKWGEHLVTICGCNDCHTPKKMTAKGPELDSTLLLSGHPAQMPPPEIDRKDIESRGLIVSNMGTTAWVGPWGISYTGNLTPDETGIGTWQESNFITAIREGKFKGLSNSRNLLPPMPWPMYRNMTDDELKAVFAYLKSLKPVKNLVPEATPPVLVVAK